MQQMSFELNHQNNANSYVPLSEKMRPVSMNHFFGQKHIFEDGSPVQSVLDRKNVTGLIFWGPPGTGKTTLARLISIHTEAPLKELSAVHSGKKELKEMIDGIEYQKSQTGEQTILFIDEIHRYNKSQQDGLLKGLERGIFTLIGATTENPGFELNKALLSRCHVIVLKSLEDGELSLILENALNDLKKGLGNLKLKFTKEALSEIVQLSDGDARHALNLLEISAHKAFDRYETQNCNDVNLRGIQLDDVNSSMSTKRFYHDKNGDSHYQTISAFIKSVRGSDVDAALYYLARMLDAGEDPVFIVRRLAILASEDIGLADSQAVIMASSVLNLVQFIGMPEARIHLGQLTVYLSLAPKSNSSYKAIDQALACVKKKGHSVDIPKKIINPANALMKKMGFGEGYHYAHDYQGGFYPESLLPESLKGSVFYQPKNIGYEQYFFKRVSELRKAVHEKEKNQ